jgi:tetratricopeptide (TPR) repeat protein
LGLYSRAYALDPTNPYAGSGIATIQVILGRFNDAAATYRNLLAISPDNPKYLRGLADALSYSLHYREAAGVNNRILSRNPRDFAAALSNAQIFTYVRNYPAADRYFNIATQVRPKDALAWTSWGESLSYRRNPRAVGALQRALTLKPGYARAELALGNYYSYIGNFNAAMPRYRSVLVSQPRNVTALVGLGDALAFGSSPEQQLRRAPWIGPRFGLLRQDRGGRRSTEARAGRPSR